eukprot:5542573-Prymnesium_polylepis.2
MAIVLSNLCFLHAHPQFDKQFPVKYSGLVIQSIIPHPTVSMKKMADQFTRATVELMLKPPLIVPA